jgi:hypothetical protein
MSKFEKYSSIEQFRNIVKAVQYHSKDAFSKRDPEGNIIPNQCIDYPVIKFYGTVKLHGTNGGIRYDIKTGEITAQSRNRRLNVENDHLNFALFVNKNKARLVKFFKNQLEHFSNDAEEHITLFGEWCGKDIQRNVGISSVDRMFVVFEMQCDNEKFFVEQQILCSDFYNMNKEDVNIRAIDEFGVFNIEIDFEDPALSTPELVKITEDVERECPVAKAYGVKNGVGEGVVWKAKYNFNGKNVNLRFKVKGEKHSVTKVKKLVAADIEKLKSVTEFVKYACTENRMLQGLEYLAEQGYNVEPKSTPYFLRWIVGDIHKEEDDVIDNMRINGIDVKMINRELSNFARKWFFKRIN